MESLVKLANRWREHAVVLDRWGRGHEAKAAIRCAEELEAAIQEWQLEVLTLDQAEVESGFSYSALQGMVAKGKVPNAGTKNRPRVHRCDLPRKAGRRFTGLAWHVTDLADEVLAAG